MATRAFADQGSPAPVCGRKAPSNNAVVAAANAIVRITGARRGSLLPGQRIAGSGVIVGADGLVVTSAHVIEDAVDLRISSPSLPSAIPTVVAINTSADFALLRISPSPSCFLTLSAKTPRTGDTVFAIGFPFGAAQAVTKGVVTATPPPQTEIASVPGLLRTDAAIAPGDSGGALVSPEGALVGVITAKYRDSGGGDRAGFALPATLVRRLAGQASLAGQPPGLAGEAPPSPTRLVGRQPLGGAQVATLSPTQALRRGIDPTLQGVLVVDPGQGYAAQSGFTAGDVVTEVNGQTVASADELVGRLQAARAWRIVVRRGAETLASTYNDDGERK